MSYKDILKKQIQELEEKISDAKEEKFELQRKLNILKVLEFEEDIKEECNIQLLKG